MVLTYDLLEDRRLDNIIIKTFFNSLLYKTNRFQVAVRLFSNRSQRTSKCGKNISDTLGCTSCATFLFLPHFDVLCDLLLNRRTVTWNLFVKHYYRETEEQNSNGCKLLVKKDAILDSLEAKERSYDNSTNGINFTIRKVNLMFVFTVVVWIFFLNKYMIQNPVFFVYNVIM